MASGNTLIWLNANGFQPAKTSVYNSPRLTSWWYYPAWRFDGTTAQHVIANDLRLSGLYSGGGLTVDIYYVTGNTSNTVWEVAFDRIGHLAVDADTLSFAAVNQVTSAGGGNNLVTKATITFTDGADMDSVGQFEHFRLLVGRDAGNGSDNAGSSYLHGLCITET